MIRLERSRRGLIDLNTADDLASSPLESTAQTPGTGEQI
jgi:hypothetical protein